jgi:hypothetical protein
VRQAFSRIDRTLSPMRRLEQSLAKVGRAMLEVTFSSVSCNRARSFPKPPISIRFAMSGCKFIDGCANAFFFPGQYYDYRWPLSVSLANTLMVTGWPLLLAALTGLATGFWFRPSRYRARPQPYVRPSGRRLRCRQWSTEALGARTMQGGPGATQPHHQQILFTGL